MWESPKPFIHRLRLYKSPAEVALMQASCRIASDAIAATIASSHSGITEHQLYARVDYECRMRGAEYLAYPPVVAGGERANIIHYINNNQVVNEGEMVLMDAGWSQHAFYNRLYWLQWDLKFHSNLKKQGSLSLFHILSLVCVCVIKLMIVLNVYFETLVCWWNENIICQKL